MALFPAYHHLLCWTREWGEAGGLLLTPGKFQQIAPDSGSQVPEGLRTQGPCLLLLESKETVLDALSLYKMAYSCW